MILESLYVLFLLVIGIGIAVNFAGGYFGGLCFVVFFIIAGVLGLWNVVHWMADTADKEARMLPVLGMLFSIIMCSGIILI